MVEAVTGRGVMARVQRAGGSIVGGLAIQVDERSKPVGLAADDRDHQWQAKRACAGKRLRVPPTPSQIGSGFWTGRG
jgi:hypothetical protein